jgi:hypothetical protein
VIPWKEGPVKDHIVPGRVLLLAQILLIGGSILMTVISARSSLAEVTVDDSQVSIYPPSFVIASGSSRQLRITEGQQVN